MEASDLKAKFKNLLHKGVYRQDSNSSDVLGRIPSEWSGLVGVGSPANKRIQGVFVSDCIDQATASDDDVLSGIEAAYFTQEGFDPILFELEGLQSHYDSDEIYLEAIDERRKRLLRQLKVVTKNAYAQILDKRPECVDEMQRVTKLEDSLSVSLKLCSDSRTALEAARNRLASSSIGILAAVKRREHTTKLLRNLTAIATLQKTDVHLRKLMLEGDYSGAIQLLLEVQQAVKTYNHFAAIRQLAVKLQDTLDLVEEQLDVALAKVCSNFNADVYEKLQEAYVLLGKTRTSMDQLQMHVTSAVHNVAWNVVYGHAMLVKSPDSDLSKKPYHDLCTCVAPETMTACMVDLCHALWLIMTSYKQIVAWHEERNGDSQGECDMDRLLERQYLQRKLKTGLSRIWQDVQTKVRLLMMAQEVGHSMAVDNFLHLMQIIHKLIEFGHDFCHSESDTLRESLNEQYSAYFKKYHSQKIEDVKMHLDNEGWALCPVRSSFQLLQLKECRQVRALFSALSGNAADWPASTPLTPPAALGCNSLVSPFQSLLQSTSSNDTVLDEDDLLSQLESDDEADHALTAEAIEEDEHEGMPRSSRAKSSQRQNRSPFVTNTSLMILRLFGSYFHLMHILRPISRHIFFAMMQLLEFYAAVVHSFFAIDAQSEPQSFFGWTSTSSRLQAVLTRVRREVCATDDDVSRSRSFVKLSLTLPTRCAPPTPLDSGDLSRLTEKLVAVESVLLIADQLQQLQPALEKLVTDEGDVKQYYSQTLSALYDLRKPVYWSVAVNAFNMDHILIQMSKVSWDIKEVKSEHSSYVDLLLRDLQMFCIRLQEINEQQVPIPKAAEKCLWDLAILKASFTFVEGFAGCKKCSNEGRALMQLDFRQFVLKLEMISCLKPLPYQDLVINYIKAYYIPENELESWVQQHPEYSAKQLRSLVNCVANNNNKTKQRLNDLINDLAAIKINIIK